MAASYAAARAVRSLATPGARRTDVNEPRPTTKDGDTSPSDDLVTRHHQQSIDGRTLRYASHTGRVVLHREGTGTGERAGQWEGTTPAAEMFVVAYTKDGVRDPATRPLTFSFNGGPGSSSVWLHLGLLGPKRVPLDADPAPTAPPYRLVDNPHGLLEHTDLVFIDPVSTGYSRAVKGGKPAEFHGLEPDVRSVGDLIRLWVSRHGRWGSPIYLIGESYGTTRAAALAAYLQSRHAMYLSGVMLVSSILDFSTARFEPGNDLPHLLFLPTYAAVAHYHGRLPTDLQALPLRDVLDEVEAWALDVYARFLALGDRADDDLVDAVAQRLSRYTGLDAIWLRGAHLRVEIMRFCKALLREQGRSVGRLDARYTARDRDAVGATPDADPSYAAILGPYGAALNDYVRRELGYESDLPYEVLTGLYATWRFEGFENRFVNVGEQLRAAMHANPALRVHVASGYYDLATPYWATEHTLAHMALDPALRGNVRHTVYEAGHMMYVHEPSLRAVSGDLAAFVKAD
jgi:carboxypeptidase C (cathepsin A)